MGPDRDAAVADKLRPLAGSPASAAVSGMMTGRDLPGRGMTRGSAGQNAVKGPNFQEYRAVRAGGRLPRNDLNR